MPRRGKIAQKWPLVVRISDLQNSDFALFEPKFLLTVGNPPTKILKYLNVVKVTSGYGDHKISFNVGYT